MPSKKEKSDSDSKGKAPPEPKGKSSKVDKAQPQAGKSAGGGNPNKLPKDQGAAAVPLTGKAAALSKKASKAACAAAREAERDAMLNPPSDESEDEDEEDDEGGGVKSKYVVDKMGNTVLRGSAQDPEVAQQRAEMVGYFELGTNLPHFTTKPCKSVIRLKKGLSRNILANASISLKLWTSSAACSLYRLLRVRRN